LTCPVKPKPKIQRLRDIDNNPALKPYIDHDFPEVLTSNMKGFFNDFLSTGATQTPTKVILYPEDDKDPDYQSVNSELEIEVEDDDDNGIILPSQFIKAADIRFSNGASFINAHKVFLSMTYPYYSKKYQVSDELNEHLQRFVVSHFVSESILTLCLISRQSCFRNILHYTKLSSSKEH